MPATGTPAAARKKVRCPKCTALLTEPPTPIYECPICSTLLLAKSSSAASSTGLRESYIENNRDTNGSSKLGKATVLQESFDRDNEITAGFSGPPHSKNPLDKTLIPKVKLLSLVIPDFPAQKRLSHSSLGSSESLEKSFREAYLSRAESSSSTGSDPDFDTSSPPWLPGHADIGLLPASVPLTNSEGVKGITDKHGRFERPGSEFASLNNHEAAQSVPFFDYQKHNKDDWSQEDGSPTLEVDLEIDNNTNANQVASNFNMQDEVDEGEGDDTKDWSSTRGAGTRSKESNESPKAKGMDVDSGDEKRMLHMDVAAGSGKKQSTGIPYRSAAMQRLLQEGELQTTAYAPVDQDAQHNSDNFFFTSSYEALSDQTPITGKCSDRCKKSTADLVHRNAGSHHEEEIAMGAMQISLLKGGDCEERKLYVGQHTLQDDLPMQEDTPSACIGSIFKPVDWPRSCTQQEKMRVSLNQSQLTEGPQHLPPPLYSNGQNVALLPNSVVYRTQSPPHNLQEQDPPHDHIPPPYLLGAPQSHMPLPKVNPAFSAHSSAACHLHLPGMTSCPVESHLHSLTYTNLPNGELQPGLVVLEQKNANVYHQQMTRRFKCYPPLPRDGALPFVLCQECKELLRVPPHLPLLYGTVQKLKCGSCGIVSKFSLPQNVDNCSNSKTSFKLRRSSVVTTSSQDYQYEKADHMLPNNTGRQSVGRGRKVGPDSHAHMKEYYEQDGPETSSFSDAYHHQGSSEAACIGVQGPHLRDSLYEPMVARDQTICDSGSQEEGTSGSDLSRSTSQSSASQLTRLPVAPGSPLVGHRSHDPRSLQHRRSAQGPMDGSRSAPWSPAPGSPLYDSLRNSRSSDLDERSYDEGEQEAHKLDGVHVQDAGKGPRYYAGLLKRSLKELGKRGSGNNDGQRVVVNGHMIPDAAVRNAEVHAGTIYPGHYWYDYQAGFWGVTGGPCLGIIPPFIEEFNLPLARDCAGGRTGVLVNGRELHKKDLQVLAKRGLPTTAGRAYIVDITGRVVDDVSGQQLKSLGKLAPSIERKGRGNGMLQPDMMQS